MRTESEFNKYLANSHLTEGIVCRGSAHDFLFKYENLCDIMTIYCDNLLKVIAPKVFNYLLTRPFPLDPSSLLFNVA